MKEQVFAQLKSHFRPEFLNRIDEIVLFKPLLLDEIKKVVDLLMERIRNRLIEKKIDIELTDSAREFIAREAYDPVYGARPLRRYLQTKVETEIAKMVIAGKVKEGHKVVVDLEDGSLVFRVN